jgi:hypothetical protein
VDDESWLVLATHWVIPSMEMIAAIGRLMNELAARNSGEYDGWEAGVEQ